MNPHHMKAAASMSAIVGGLGDWGIGGLGDWGLEYPAFFHPNNNSVCGALKQADTTVQDSITITSENPLHA